MLKRARSSVGIKRAKKKKVEESRAVEEESEDLADIDEFEDEGLPPTQPPVTHADPARESEPIPTLLEQVEAEAEEALHKAEVIHRRWKKTVDTYFNDGASAWLWKEDSVVQRNLARLKLADEERDAAFDFVEYKIKECRITKTLEILRRYARRFPGNASYKRQRDLARERLHKHRMSIIEDEHREPRPERDFSVEEQMELLIKQVGLAKAIQWVHMRGLREAPYWSN